MTETGLVPYGFPVKETGGDGSMAWTLRRDGYFIFIELPFAALTDFLDRMAMDSGPIRSTSAPDLRFELRPLLMLGGFGTKAESVALFDQARMTRSFLKLAPVGETNAVPTIEQVMEAERDAPATRAKIEAISRDVVTEIKYIFLRVTKGAASCA